MRTAVRRAARRVGRRGTVLCLKGTMALGYGYAQLADPPRTNTGYRLLLGLLPSHLLGWAWVLAGATALVCVPLRQGKDWPGFAAVCVVATGWAGASLASWWLYNNPRGWVGGVVFAAFGAVAAVVAGWPENEVGR